MKFSRKQLQHLFLRAGFGLTPPELDQMENQHRDDVLNMLFVKPKTQLLNALVEPTRKDTGEVRNIQVAKMIVKSRQDLVSLNNAWIENCFHQGVGA